MGDPIDCAICGEPIDDDEPYTTLSTGHRVCADASACVRRWIVLSREQRDRIRQLNDATGVETR